VAKRKDFKSFYNSLNKIKSLPNETLIFPGSEFAAENLIFAKIIDTNNEFVKNKLDEVKNKDRNFGQVLGQERLYNPFFRCDQKYFLNLFEAEDPFSCFVKMKKMMEKNHKKIKLINTVPKKLFSLFKKFYNYCLKIIMINFYDKTINFYHKSVWLNKNNNKMFF
jgi:hypothetical protein